MHVACSTRSYQLRLQSCELGLRPRYVSAASRPSPLLQRQMPCFLVFTDRDEAYPLRAHAVTPPSVAALPIPKHEACTSRLESSSFRPPGAKSRSGWPVAVSQTTASVASGSSASSVSERRYMASEHAYDPSAGCWQLMASEPLWSWRWWWWWWPLMPNLAGPWTGRVSEASEAIINPRSFVRSLAALQAPFKTS